MKHLITAIVLSLTLSATSQDWQRIAIRSGMVFAGGFMDGTAESLRVHYSEFKAVHPGAKDQFWNPSISWTNKYADGLQPYDPRWYHFGVAPIYKERFPYSTTMLAWSTDGYHLLRTGRNITLVVAIAIPLRHKKSLRNYVIEAASYMVAYGLGFTLAYDIIY